VIIHAGDLGPYDIVCGRCGNAYNNIGNRRFRVTIRLNLAKYQELQSRHGRSLLFVSLVRFLKNEVGVRFFKPIKNDKKQLNQQGGHWYVEMTEKEARDKVGHAFRDLARTAKTQKQTNDAAEQRMGATLSHAMNHTARPTLDSIRSGCTPPSAAPTKVRDGIVMTCNDFF